MESILMIAVFLAPYFQSAGNKIAEKTIEALFDSRRDIADKFTRLFNDEIISLNLSDISSVEEITKELEGKPEVMNRINEKIANNPSLMKELFDAFKQMPLTKLGDITINSEKIAQINVNSYTVTQTIENF